MLAQAVREIDTAPDGLAAFGKVTAEELGAGLVAHLVRAGEARSLCQKLRTLRLSRSSS